MYLNELFEAFCLKQTQNPIKIKKNFSLTYSEHLNFEIYNIYEQALLAIKSLLINIGHKLVYIS
jgi:hypothetical protein